MCSFAATKGATPISRGPASGGNKKRLHQVLPRQLFAPDVSTAHSFAASAVQPQPSQNQGLVGHHPSISATAASKGLSKYAYGTNEHHSPHQQQHSQTPVWLSTGPWSSPSTTADGSLSVGFDSGFGPQPQSLSLGGSGNVFEGHSTGYGSRYSFSPSTDTGSGFHQYQQQQSFGGGVMGSPPHSASVVDKFGGGTHYFYHPATAISSKMVAASTTIPCHSEVVVSNSCPPDHVDADDVASFGLPVGSYAPLTSVSSSGQSNYHYNSVVAPLGSDPARQELFVGRSAGHRLPATSTQYDEQNRSLTDYGLETTSTASSAWQHAYSSGDNGNWDWCGGDSRDFTNMKAVTGPSIDLVDRFLFKNNLERMAQCMHGSQAVAALGSA
jgi:hypothetical protein